MDAKYIGNYYYYYLRGFYNAFIGIQYMMLDAVQLLRAKYPTAIVSVTGHSLGASIATHALVFLVHVCIIS